RFGVSPEEFHDGNDHIVGHWPGTLLATSTHDTKRAEDTRARIALLSEIPTRFAGAVADWSRMNERHRADPSLPDRNAEWLLYQALVGAWPISAERAAAYMEKASKEAKEYTSWVDPDPVYDDALRRFVEAVLSDAEAAAGRADVWPVRADSGLPKLLLTQRVLQYRSRRPAYFCVGSGYRCLAAAGARAAHAVVFARTAAGGDPDAARVVAVAPRLVLGLGGDWAGTALTLPDGRWSDVLDGGRRTFEGEVALAELLAPFPVALLER